MPVRKWTDAEEQAIADAYASGVPSTELGRTYGASPGAVLKAVARRGGASRPLSEAKRSLSPEDDETIAGRYANGESAHVLAKAFKVGPHTILAAVRRRGGEVKPRGFNGWKGGRRLPNSNGYIRIMIPADDPCASMRDGGGCVYEHRLVMARLIGRPLLPDETVHHINGVRTDNRPENLQLRRSAHGAGQVYRCGDCHSIDVEAIAL